MKIYNPLKMGKPDEDGSRKGGIALALAGVLAACSPANAENKGVESPGPVQMANLTKADCLKIGEREKKLVCLRAVGKRALAILEAENAALTQQEKGLDADKDATNSRINSKTAENAAKTKEEDQVNTTIKVLSKLNEVTRDEFDKDNQRDPS